MVLISGEKVVTEIITWRRNNDFHFSPKRKNGVQNGVPIILILNSKCKEGASDDNAYWGIPINFRSLIQTQKGAIIIHDCIYQFLRIFYHSRFKPQQLEMTATQLLAPVLDLILTLPLVMRLLQEFSRFSNATKMRVQSKPEMNG